MASMESRAQNKKDIFRIQFVSPEELQLDTKQLTLAVFPEISRPTKLDLPLIMTALVKKINDDEYQFRVNFSNINSELTSAAIFIVGASARDIATDNWSQGIDRAIEYVASNLAKYQHLSAEQKTLVFLIKDNHQLSPMQKQRIEELGFSQGQIHQIKISREHLQNDINESIKSLIETNSEQISTIQQNINYIIPNYTNTAKEIIEIKNKKTAAQDEINTRKELERQAKEEAATLNKQKERQAEEARHVAEERKKDQILSTNPNNTLLATFPLANLEYLKNESTDLYSFFASLNNSDFKAFGFDLAFVDKDGSFMDVNDQNFKDTVEEIANLFTSEINKQLLLRIQREHNVPYDLLVRMQSVLDIKIDFFLNEDNKIITDWVISEFKKQQINQSNTNNIYDFVLYLNGAEKQYVDDEKNVRKLVTVFPEDAKSNTINFYKKILSNDELKQHFTPLVAAIFPKILYADSNLHHDIMKLVDSSNSRTTSDFERIIIRLYEAKNRENSLLKYIADFPPEFKDLCYKIYTQNDKNIDQPDWKKVYDKYKNSKETATARISGSNAESSSPSTTNPLRLFDSSKKPHKGTSTKISQTEDNLNNNNNNIDQSTSEKTISPSKPEQMLELLEKALSIYTEIEKKHGLKGKKIRSGKHMTDITKLVNECKALNKNMFMSEEEILRGMVNRIDERCLERGKSIFCSTPKSVVEKLTKEKSDNHHHFTRLMYVVMDAAERAGIYQDNRRFTDLIVQNPRIISQQHKELYQQIYDKAGVNSANKIRP